MTGQPKPTRVVYVSGFGRSGSTVVEGLLQRRLAASGVGEIFFLWERGALRNELCGCGLQFRRCPFWTEVLNDAFGRVTEFDAQIYDREFKKARGRRPQFSSMHEAGSATPLFKQVASALYASIGKHIDGDVLIDSSKYPFYGAWLTQTPGIDLSVLHLFRDPRGVTYSWSLLKDRPESVGDQDYMAVSRSPLASIWRWKWFNHWSDELRHDYGLRSAPVFYERFCDEPETYLQAIAAALDLPPRTKPKGEWHSVSGNPLRFTTDELAIEKDQRWRSELGPATRSLTSFLCGRQYRALRREADAFLAEAQARTARLASRRKAPRIGS